MSVRKRDKHRSRPLSVLYTDSRWVAVDKPAGIPVHGGAGQTSPSVLERLERELNARLHLVHRLDRSTAGVLLLARSGATARSAAAMWGRVQKTYWAIVRGLPQAPQTIELPLKGPDGRNQAARTHIETARALGGGALGICSVRIQTGRLHQIRRHLASVTHPVLMDDKYGDFAANKAFVRTTQDLRLSKPKHALLFCAQLMLPHDAGVPRLVAPWPRSWPPLLRALGVSVDDLSSLT